MGDGKKSLLAIALSVGFFILWYSVISPMIWPEMKQANQGTPTAVTAPADQAASPAKTETAKADMAAETTSAVTSRVVATEEAKEEGFATLKGKNFVAKFSNVSAAPVEWTLDNYTTTKEQGGGLVNTISSTKVEDRPLTLRFEKANFLVPADARFKLVEEKEGLLRYRWASKDVSIEKIYTAGSIGYDIGLKVIVKNLGAETLKGRMGIGWSGLFPKAEKRGMLGFLKGPANTLEPIYYMNGKFVKEANPAKLKSSEVDGKLWWAGVEDRYFVSVVAPISAGESLGAEMNSFKDGERVGFYSGSVLPELMLTEGASADYNFTVYSGPKELPTLKKFNLNFDKAIDYGWFSFIAIPILYALKFIYGLIGNYGVAIIILTIIIKILLNPISKKSLKGMKGMKDLQPKIAELKEKHKGNKERINVEMMQLFKTHKVNPASGCIPMLLQFPVYIALYRVLWNSIELYQAPFFWFYKDLSAPDPYFITPLLLGVFMFLQQKMTPSTTADPAQQKMMMIMPVMFTAFMAFLPVGLVIYIMINTMMSVLQQWMYNNDIRFRDLVRGRFTKMAKAM